MKCIRLSSRGDTLIEVLIAVAIIGAVLSGSYISATRSLNTGRRAQERTEALQLAQAQLESVKAAMGAPASSNAIFDLGSTRFFFCFNTDNSQQPVVLSSGVSDSVFDDDLNNPAVCRSGSFYNVSIEYNEERASAPQGGLFTARVRWQRLGSASSNGKDEVVLRYRAYEQ